MTVYCKSLDKMLVLVITDISTSLKFLYNKDFDFFWKCGNYTLKSLTKGGFGAINEMSLFKNLVVDSKNNSLVVKINNNSFKSDPRLFQGIWLLDFDVAEVYFCPFIAYLNQLKVCPFLCNYVSVNVVDNNYVLFIERYTFEMIKFLPQLTVEYTIQFLFQLTYTFFILKQYLGMVHFDVHLRNVMTVKSNSSYLFFDQYNGHGIYLPFMPFEVRLIDFGFCTIDLRNSCDEFLKTNLCCAPFNLRLLLEIPSLYKTSRLTRSKLLTVELQYFCLHLYQVIQRQAPHHPILNIIQQFCDCMYQQPTNLTNPSLKPDHWILHDHDVGVVTPTILKPSDLMTGLERYCKLYGSVTEFRQKKVYIPFKNIQLDETRLRIVTPRSTIDLQKYQRFLKSEIPCLRWFEPTFTVFNSQFGHVYRFIQTNSFIRISDQTPPEDQGIGIYYRNKPFNITNAYMTHEKGRIRFQVNRRPEDFKNSYYVGKFIYFAGKKVSNVEVIPRLFFAISESYFYVFQLPTDNIDQLLKFYNCQYMIDASSCSFFYQGQLVYLPEIPDIKPLIYLLINE